MKSENSGLVRSGGKRKSWKVLQEARGSPSALSPFVDCKLCRRHVPHLHIFSCSCRLLVALAASCLLQAESKNKASTALPVNWNWNWNTNWAGSINMWIMHKQLEHTVLHARQTTESPRRNTTKFGTKNKYEHFPGQGKVYAQVIRLCFCVAQLSCLMLNTSAFFSSFFPENKQKTDASRVWYFFN